MKPWTAQPDSISSGTLLEEKTYFSNSGSNVSVPCCSWPFFGERHQGIKLKSLRKACIFFSSFLVHPLPNILLKSSVTDSKCWFQSEEHSDLNWDESSQLRKRKGRKGEKEGGRKGEKRKRKMRRLADAKWLEGGSVWWAYETICPKDLKNIAFQVA